MQQSPSMTHTISQTPHSLLRRMKVHFICRGNALRSVIAEAYLKSLAIPGITTLSSGTVADCYRTQNEPTLETTNALLAQKGFGDLTKNHSEQLTQDRINASDLTICMNQTVYEEAKSNATLPPSTIVWDVVDVGEGIRTLDPNDKHTKYDDLIYLEIMHRVDELVKTF